jgi:hypothetical protein
VVLVLHGQIEFNYDSEVIGPKRTPESVCQTIRAMRKATPSFGSVDTDITISDLFVLANIFHTIFTEMPDTILWPVCSRHEDDRTLIPLALLHARLDDWDVFFRAEAEDYLAAANIVRWLLGVRQQPHPLLVLREPPGEIEEITAWRSPESQLVMAAG